MVNNRSLYCLAKDEDILLAAPGLYTGGLRSWWKPGRYYLTGQRLLLFQPPRIVFQVPVCNITDITTEKRDVVLRTKDVIRITYSNPSGNRIARMLNPSSSSTGTIFRKAWIAINDIGTWKSRIFERSLLTVDKKGIDMLMEELDFESREIVNYLRERRHANLDEIASLYAAPNYMNILFRIRDVINPIAERVLGYRLLTFERVKIDKKTGKLVIYNWWIAGGTESENDIKDSILDIFDEGDSLSIVMEVSDVREEDVSVDVDKGKLVVSVNGGKLNKEIQLPSEVTTEGLTRKYNNGILEIRAKKAIF